MAWTAPDVERTHPVRTTADREALESWLDFHRATLLSKCAGLSAEQLKERAVTPSTLSLLGLVRHLAENERWWFRRHAGGEVLDNLYCTDEEPDADLDDLDGADAEADLATFSREVDAARAVASTRDLDAMVQSKGHHSDVTMNVRWIYLHMIEEYARHNGHADLLRERLDGVTGE